MSLGSKYNDLCPLFDFGNSGGVLFPYFPMALGQAASNLRYIDLDGSASTIQARIRLPMASRLITCEAFAVSDDQGTKTAAATAEPVLGIKIGTAPLASIDAGTSIAIITCDLTGDVGHKWAGTTTPTDITTNQELIVHLKTAAEGTVSGVQDGGAVPVLWFAAVNSPE